MDIDAAIYDTNHNFFSADTAKFLQEFLDIPSTCIDEIYAKLEATHFPNGLWTDMPQSTDAPESAYYAPFTKIANDISDAVKASSDFLQSTHAERVVGTWVHASNQTPEFFDPRTFLNRPDCMLITSSPTINLVDRALSNVEYDCDEESSVAEEKEEYWEKQKLRETQLRMWWRHVHALVKFKTDTQVEDWEDAYLRISQYMRCMFAEQFDRRSLFGIVLCRDQLAVVACDRSGLTRMFNPINIRIEARKFIQVIASFTYLPAHRLGWDPSMKIYDPKTDTQRPSYDIDTPDYILEQSKLTTHWCISIPTPEGAREDVITIHRRNISHDFNKLYVLKRYWRSLRKDEIPSLSAEAQLYGNIDDAKDRLYSYEDIFIDGQVDSTRKYIRGDVEIIGGRPPHVTPEETEWKVLDENDLEVEQYLHRIVVYPDPDPFKSRDPNTIISRAHTQIVMPFFGESVRHFKSRLELVEVILAAVRDHEMFYRKGVLHRDVSAGNIIITNQKTAENDTFKDMKGRLIDLDHAKSRTPTKPKAPFNPTEKQIQRFIENLAYVQEDDSPEPFSCDANVARKALQSSLHRAHHLAYTYDVALMRKEHFGSIKPGQIITLTDLGWDKMTPTLLDFSGKIVGDEGRTGTPPYMSAEVLAEDLLFHNHSDDTPFFHDAVHDMESFMWIVANICLTRTGPGINARWDKSQQDPFAGNTIEPGFKDLVAALFYSQDDRALRYKKASIFRSPKLMEDVVGHFHPYFKPLGPMVLRWWNILVIAYKFREYEYRNIHAHIIDILDIAINDLKTFPTTPEETEAEKQEEERREKLRRDALLPFFRLSHADSERLPQGEDRGQISKCIVYPL